jgi:hypothetical protein
MAFYKPWRKLLCPYCFNKFHPGDCRIISKNRVDANNQPLTLKGQPTGAAGKLISRVWIRRLVGEDLVLAEAARICPLCNHELPSNIELADNYIIALVGNAGAGKTHYIAAGIQELLTPDLWKAIGVAHIQPQNPATQRKYRTEYYDVLYNGMAPPLTQRGQPYDPLIYLVKFPPGGKRSRPANLIFYDVSGEDIANPATMVIYAKYIFHASAIIVLADPLTIAGISDRILPQYRLTAQQLQLIQGDVLIWVTQLYEDFHKSEKVEVPTAITLSKADLLKFLNHPYAFFNTPSYKDAYGGGRLRRQDFEEVNIDVQEVLATHGGEGQLQWKPQFENVHFFAVSATGWPKDPTTGTYPAIQPIRVLDPLLWVLAQLEIIEAW